ncbi:MAG: hypothetical protein AAB316_15895, partial [Bacteroidota bacterium]
MTKPLRLFSRHGLLLTILATAGLIALRYQKLLAHLAEPICMECYRDGIKTYLNAIWHARFGSSATWFEGMNYPYKEHIVAATELPGLAILLKWLTPLFPTLPDYIYGITHLLILLSILLCAVFLYLIFRGLRLPVWYSVPVAIGLTFLAPQNLRFVPHLGLAPPFVIPAVIWGLLKFHQKPSWKVSGFLGLVVFVASMLHFYFFAMTVLTITGYLFFALFQPEEKKLTPGNQAFREKKNFIFFLPKSLISRCQLLAPHYFLMVLLPLAFFLFWLILNDPVTDRSPKPWGFLNYMAQPESVFASLEFPLYKWINDHWVRFERVSFEGWAYIGIVADVFILVAVFRWLFSRFQKNLLGFFEPDERRFFYPLLGAGIVLLLLACSFPFVIPGLEGWLDHAGMLRQFRSTGRFAWVFYFVINVVALAGLFHLLSAWRRKAAKILCFGLILSALTYEAWVFTNNQFMFHGYEQVPELMPGKRFTDQLDLDFSKYQAIIPIPYYNVGSNNFGAPGGQTSIQQSLILGAQTGLPVTGAMLTRSSRQQAFRQLQLVNQPYRMPAVFEDYPNDKPLLLLWSKPFSEDDEKRYGHLRQEAHLLHETERWSFYEIDLAAFQRRIEQRKVEVLEAKKAKKLHRVSGFLSTDSVENFVFQNFDNQSAAENVCLGNGAWQGKAGDLNTLFSGSLPQAKAGNRWHVLAWFFVNEDRFSQTLIRIREEDEKGRKLQEKAYMPGHQAVEYDPR